MFEINRLTQVRGIRSALSLSVWTATAVLLMGAAPAPRQLKVTDPVCPLGRTDDGYAVQQLECRIGVVASDPNFIPLVLDSPPLVEWRSGFQASTSDEELSPKELGYTTGVDPGTKIIRRTYHCSLGIECLSRITCGVDRRTVTAEIQQLLDPPRSNWPDIHRNFCPSDQENLPDDFPGRFIGYFPAIRDLTSELVPVRSVLLTRDAWVTPIDASATFPSAATVCSEELGALLASSGEEMSAVAKSYCPALTTALEASTKPWTIWPPCCTLPPRLPRGDSREVLLQNERAENSDVLLSATSAFVGSE